MNKYWAIACLVLFVSWSGFMYYEGISKADAVCKDVIEKHDLAQQAVTVAAQNSVIATVETQQTITEGVEHDYQTKKSIIDSKYPPAGSVQRQDTGTTIHGVPATGKAACGFDAATSRPLPTTVFRLDAEECDENTEQLYSLQNWVREQRSIKR